MEKRDGVDEEPPPDEDLAEVVRVARVAPEPARDESPAVCILCPEGRLLRVGRRLDHQPDQPDDCADDRPGSEAGSAAAVEQVGDRQHDHGDGDRLQQPEAREAQRLVPHLVEAVVDLHPQDAPEQVRPQSHRPDEYQQRRDELHRMPPACERKHHREQRERQAVGEVGDDVRPARGGDGEEGAVQRECDREGETDGGHAARRTMPSSIPSKTCLCSGRSAYQ